MTFNGRFRSYTNENIDLKIETISINQEQCKYTIIRSCTRFLKFISFIIFLLIFLTLYLLINGYQLKVKFKI